MGDRVQDNRNDIRNKGLLMLSLIVLVFIVIRFTLVFIGAKLGETRENELNQIKMDALVNIVSDGNAQRSAADERLTWHEAADTKMVAKLLKELVTEDGYIGPRLLPSGFVVELRGDRVILPEEYQAYSGAVTREMISEGLRSGAMSRAVAPEPADQEDASADAPLSAPGFLSFEKISEDAIYISVLAESEYNAYLDRHSRDNYEALESANAVFGGIALLLQEQEDELRLVSQVGVNEETEEAFSPALLEEMLRELPTELTLNDRNYLCTYHEIVSRSAEGDSLFLIQMLPLVSLREQNIKRALLIDLVMVISFLTITVYVLSVQRYTTEHELTPEQAALYQPGRMRVRMFIAGVLSVLTIFALALLIESVGQFYMELRYGKDALSIFSTQLETADQRRRKNIQEEEEAWYAYYGEEMASLLSSYPELASSKILQESCEALELDYIMLFDAEGKLSCCSREYAGIALTDDQDNDLYDFRRLMYGMPGSIILDSSEDGMTGLERHLIGVKLPFAEGAGMHGALIMALKPDYLEKSASSRDSDISLTVADGTYCFAADFATGEILYSNGASMVGKTIYEYGLPESSLRDAYMDFSAIAGDIHLVVTSREGDFVRYYAVESEAMFRHVLRYGTIVAAFFALVLSLLLIFLLGGYNEKAYQEWIDLFAQRKQLESSEDFENTFGRLGTKLEYNIEESSLRRKISSFLRWDQMLPKEKTITALRISLIVLLICCLEVLHGTRLTNESHNTMLGFLLNGDWMRGPNLFGLCNTLLIVAIAYLINQLSILVLNLTSRLASGRGQTISRLVYSCIKYVSVFCVIYFGLGYLGFPTSTIVASLGVVSLALSLGAQDLIRDILAGLAIVFDGSFQVGDVVKINGTRGTIEEIGVRSTKLKIPVDNILIINNHEIKDIVNLSQRLSEFKLEIRVPAEQPLFPMEELLKRELPLIGEKFDAIVYGPYLVGVTELPTETMTLRPSLKLTVGAKIHEKDNYAVKLFLNREVKLLFEREGIELI